MQKPHPKSPSGYVGAHQGALPTSSRKVTRATQSSSREFSLERAIAMQTEFCKAFSEDVFQQQLHSLTLEHDRNTAQFTKARHKLVFTVQERILPKYGFEGTQLHSQRRTIILLPTVQQRILPKYGVEGTLAGVFGMIAAFSPYYHIEEFNKIRLQNDRLLGLETPEWGSPEHLRGIQASSNYDSTYLKKAESAYKTINEDRDVHKAAPNVFGKAPVGWRRCALDFADMLHEMQQSNVCGRQIMAQLATLLSDSAKEDVYYAVGFCISEFVHEVVTSLYMPNDESSSTPVPLGNLLCNLEKRAAAATKHMDPACDWTTGLDVLNEETLQVLTAATSGEHRFLGFDLGTRHILCVALPLSLYVRHNPHLYEMLRRMRSLGQASRGSSVQEFMDKGGQPYSALAFAIMAALQMLHAEASEPHGHRENAHADILQELRPFQGTSGKEDTSFMFRGVWVSSTIDEARATYQWSFNSFSRCLEGVCHVLNFYAGVEGSDTWKLATKECHVLFMIARRAESMNEVVAKDWAFPVEFFNGWRGALEQELLVPPFAAYTFEENCELSGSMALDEQMSRIQRLEQRWNMRHGSLLASAPLLRDLLDGYAEPLRHTLDHEGWTPKVTVRFIRCINIADPIKELLENVSFPLWEFPCAHQEHTTMSADVPRRAVQEQWSEGTEYIAMRHAEYESRQAELMRTLMD